MAHVILMQFQANLTTMVKQEKAKNSATLVFWMLATILPGHISAA